jgi:hypothetical protein
VKAADVARMTMLILMGVAGVAGALFFTWLFDRRDNR